MELETGNDCQSNEMVIRQARLASSSGPTSFSMYIKMLGEPEDEATSEYVVAKYALVYSMNFQFLVQFPISISISVFYRGYRIPDTL